MLRYFSSHFKNEETPPSFATYHLEFWKWIEALKEYERPRPFVAVWPREGGKSTNVELAIINLAHRRVKSFCVYVCATQDQANDHVGNIANALENSIIADVDPDLCEREIGKYGHSKGWRMNRLRTASGLTVIAVGLDAMGRGAKIGKRRPDIIVLDDIDKDNDSELAVIKKIGLLTRKIIPSGNKYVAILAVQNLVHGQSVFSRLVDGRAEFLHDAIISGPYQAIKGLTYEKDNQGRATITGGEATWDNLSIPRCQSIINDIGLNPFLSEYQHDKSAQQGAFFADLWADSVHMVDPFDIPRSWRIDRSFDYGYAKPFSIIWWAQADGEARVNGRLYPRGTLFAIKEWYGWNGKPNQGAMLNSPDMAEALLKVERNDPMLKGRVLPGPADPSIWSGPPNNNIATQMAAKRCFWYPCDTGPGSRVNGARLFRERLTASNQTPMTEAGIFFFRSCVQLHRCLPQLPKDPKNPDDVDTGSEDHNYDAARYRIQWKPVAITHGTTSGLY